MTDVNVYVCKESAAFGHGGDMIVVHKGVTRVRAGHPMLEEHPELFEPIDVHYDLPQVERATAEPGEKRTISLPSKKQEPVKRDDDLDALQKQAEQAGVKVDKRWGPDRLRQEIADADKGKE